MAAKATEKTVPLTHLTHLLRSMNDDIADIAADFERGDPAPLLWGFACECGNRGCAEWVERDRLQPGQVAHVKLFLIFYWVMTGLHALHMTIGIGAVLAMFVMAASPGHRIRSGGIVGGCNETNYRGSSPGCAPARTLRAAHLEHC